VGSAEYVTESLDVEHKLCTGNRRLNGKAYDPAGRVKHDIDWSLA